jgi:hypothetical protein
MMLSLAILRWCLLRSPAPIPRPGMLFPSPTPLAPLPPPPLRVDLPPIDLRAVAGGAAGAGTGVAAAIAAAVVLMLGVLEVTDLPPVKRRPPGVLVAVVGVRAMASLGGSRRYAGCFIELRALLSFVKLYRDAKARVMVVMTELIRTQDALFADAT